MNYPYQPQAARPNAPGAVPALVLGILGLVLCVICAPFAISQGNQARRYIAASPGQYGGDGLATAGIIMGWIGVGLLALGLLAFILIVVVGVAST